MKEKKKEPIVVHFLINLCLIAMVFTMVLMCGLIPTMEVVSASKSYNGVIYQGNENRNKVAIMVNVYWGNEYLFEMLDIFAKYNVKATFFIGGSWAKSNEETLKTIYNFGHEIGNHGFNHKEHSKISYQESYNEISLCHSFVYKTLGIEMNLFAPPGGTYNLNTTKSACELGYKTILWTFDTIDWRDQNPQLILQRATQEICPGALILMHPTRATSEVLGSIIEAVNGKNLALDTVSNTIKD